jgi:hypothetical protein
VFYPHLLDLFQPCLSLSELGKMPSFNAILPDLLASELHLGGRAIKDGLVS